MGIFRPPKTATKSAVVDPNIEGDIREIVERAPHRHSRVSETAITAEIISDGVERIAGEPLAQIGRAMDELTQLRDHLQMQAERMQDEIARVHNEIVGYTQMSEDAVESIRAIDRAVGEFKGAAKPSS